MSLPPLYPILDTLLLSTRGIRVEDAAEAMIEGGARILQLRHKDFFSRGLFETAERVAALCGSVGARFVINDRADIAALLGAGLHLGQDDLEPDAARRVTGSQTIIGFSTHNERQFLSAALEPIDYVAFGPIFATASKRNPDPVVGISELRRLRALSGRPVVAIGGITRGNAREAIAAGADSVAVIGDLMPEKATSAALRTRTEEWLALLAA